MIANRLISWIGGVPLHDYGCSLKAYRRESLEDVRLYGEMHRFIPIYASWDGARVAEIPVEHHPRTMGKSKYGLSRTVQSRFRSDDDQVYGFVSDEANLHLRFVWDAGIDHFRSVAGLRVFAFLMKFLSWPQS